MKIGQNGPNNEKKKGFESSVQFGTIRVWFGMLNVWSLRSSDITQLSMEFKEGF
jgi:hypothetical protein